MAGPSCVSLEAKQRRAELEEFSNNVSPTIVVGIRN